jgi:hypothetical protein
MAKKQVYIWECDSCHQQADVLKPTKLPDNEWSHIVLKNNDGLLMERDICPSCTADIVTAANNPTRLIHLQQQHEEQHGHH